VSWLELFYDLVLVATTIVFSHSIAHHPTWEQVAWSAGMFSLIWWAWLLTTLIMNADQGDARAKRVLIFFQMLMVVLLTIAGGHAVDPQADAIGPLYAGLLLTIAALLERTRRSNTGQARFAARRRNLLIGAAILIGISNTLSTPFAVAAWVVGLALAVMPVFVEQLDRGYEAPSLHLEHLGERMSALTTVVLGEAFITVALTAATRPLESINFVVLCLEFVIVCSVGVAYFDDIAAPGMPSGRTRQRWWIVGHLPLHLATIGLAVGLGAFVKLQASTDLSLVDVYLLAEPFALVYLALGVMGLLGPHRAQARLLALRIGTALGGVALGVLAWWAPFMTVEVTAAAFGALALGHIVAASLLRARTAPVATTTPPLP
jgi:low temperature requirement protein LtrA